tara:strand:- start:259 stop:411 length:153 start_codon:yes stop_codon:yes gene_type:complete
MLKPLSLSLKLKFVIVGNSKSLFKSFLTATTKVLILFVKDPNQAAFKFST